MNFNVVKQGVRRQRTTITATIKVRIRNRHTSRSSSTSAATESSFSSSSDNKFPLPSSNTATPYEIFHLPKTCSSAEIKSRYYDLVKIYHPDRALAFAATEDQENQHEQPSLSQQQAHDNFKKVREAYTLLSNETKRRMYDHSGYGWNLMNPGSSTMEDFQGGVWKGGFPRNAAEWAAYDAWSASFRRRAGGSNNRSGWRGGVGHDKFGWQTYAGSTHNPTGSNWFYGYGHQHFSDGNHQKPLYTTNARFFVSLTSLTAILAIFQYARLHQERQMIRGGVEDKRHQTAVQSLEEARKFARSEVGRARMEEMRKRARETSPALTEQQNDWQGIVGRGGPSGKKAYEERMKRIEEGEVI